MKRKCPQFQIVASAQCGNAVNCPHLKRFREINLQHDSLVKKLLWRNFRKKKSWGKILKFPHCALLSGYFFVKVTVQKLHSNPGFLKTFSVTQVSSDCDWIPFLPLSNPLGQTAHKVVLPSGLQIIHCSRKKLLLWRVNHFITEELLKKLISFFCCFHYLLWFAKGDF